MELAPGFDKLEVQSAEVIVSMVLCPAKRGMLVALLALVLSAQAEVIPGLFIVELETEPAAEIVAKTGRREASARRLAAIREEQGRVRASLERSGRRVINSVETVFNGLVVEAPAATAAELAATPGVRRVYPVQEVKLELDHAIALHRIPEGWLAAGGMDRAGQGVKIAILDTGIDQHHVAFQDPSLHTPEGFPRANQSADLSSANTKVIVVRNYEHLLGRQEGATPRDVNGHGTGVAMAAAGVPHHSPFGEVMGAAPKAYLGNYKVFSGAASSTTRSDIILRAIDDAVSDGMDVINLSLGVSPVRHPSQDALVQAVERAAAAGVIVVKSAGNRGPDRNSLSSPGSTPAVISVGASWNSRILAASATVGEAPPMQAIAGSGPKPAEPLVAALFDVSRLDRDGLACAAFPAESLRGYFAFILRGECTFETKLLNAERAGAVAALVYTDEARPEAVVMAAVSAQLPGLMLSHQDGLKVKNQLREEPETVAILRFEGAPFPVDPFRVASLSSRGPDEVELIKPDLLAVGVEVYTATQQAEPLGELYNARGYMVVDGTSFSAPLVSGAAAVLKAARPGLKLEHYRSLLINNTSTLGPDTEGAVQLAGAGRLNLQSALTSTVAAVPTSLSFGSGGAAIDATRRFKLANLGSEADTFSLTVQPRAPGTAPTISATGIWLEPNAEEAVALEWRANALEPGEYDGFILIRSARTGVSTRIPYWYAVASNEVRNITIVNSPTTGLPGATVTAYFKMTDPSGVVVGTAQPQVTVASGGGSVVSVRSVDDEFPGVTSARLRLGPAAGSNVFRIQVGELRRDVTIRGTTSP